MPRCLVIRVKEREEERPESCLFPVVRKNPGLPPAQASSLKAPAGPFGDGRPARRELPRHWPEACIPRALGSERGWTPGRRRARPDVLCRGSQSIGSAPQGPLGSSFLNLPGRGHTGWRRRAGTGRRGGRGSGRHSAEAVALVCSVPERSGPGCVHISHFVFSDTFRVKKSPKRSPLSDPPSQVRCPRDVSA